MGRIGRMRESIALQSNTEVTSTGTGFRTAGWVTYAASVPAECVQQGPGAEAIAQSAVVADLAVVFRIRNRTDVRPKHRVLWDGQVLQIHAVTTVTNVGDRYLLLTCGQTQ